MATNLTPIAGPKGGFPLVLSVPVKNGEVYTINFPAAGVRDITRTNACPNPKFGTLASTNWTNSGNPTFTAASLPGNIGPPPTAQPITTGLHVIADAAGDRATCSGMVTIGGVVYTVSHYIYTVSNNTGPTRLLLRDDVGAVISTFDWTPNPGRWERPYITGLVPAASCRIDVQQQGAGSWEYWLTGNQCAATPLPNPYFDGDTNSETAWTGAVDLSASTDSMARTVSTFKSMYAINNSDVAVLAVS